VLDKDFVLPIGKAKVMREGSHITVTAFSKMVGAALEAADELEKEGISVEVGVAGGGGSGLCVFWRGGDRLLDIVWVIWECLLHVSTFATTRVALPTGVEAG
jgi:hypothetical protein